MAIVGNGWYGDWERKGARPASGQARRTHRERINCGLNEGRGVCVYHRHPLSRERLRHIKERRAGGQRIHEKPPKKSYGSDR